MPTYTYRCDSCGHRYDAWQSFDEESPTDCPKCDGPVRRVIAPPAVIFRGPGFYSTDRGPA